MSLVFVVGLVIDRIIALYFRANIDKDAFLKGLKKHIYAGDLDKAISFTASQKKTPLTSVIKAGLINVPKGEQDVQAAMDEATLRESPKIEARTGYLAMLGNVATLLGLLGTIIGLIGAFGAVANANPADKATHPRQLHLRGDELHRLRPPHRDPGARRLLGAAGPHAAHGRRDQRDARSPC